MVLPFQSDLRMRARELRKSQTKAESVFWEAVRQRRCLGYKFSRQKPILSFIADFYCHELSLVIEIDGDIHSEQREYDDLRSSELHALNLHVIRYTNDQVLSDLPSVMKDLEKRIPPLKSSPSLSREGVRGWVWQEDGDVEALDRHQSSNTNPANP